MLTAAAAARNCPQIRRAQPVELQLVQRAPAPLAAAVGAPPRLLGGAASSQHRERERLPPCDILLQQLGGRGCIATRGAARDDSREVAQRSRQTGLRNRRQRGQHGRGDLKQGGPVRLRLLLQLQQALPQRRHRGRGERIRLGGWHDALGHSQAQRPRARWHRQVRTQLRAAALLLRVADRRRQRRRKGAQRGQRDGARASRGAIASKARMFTTTPWPSDSLLTLPSS